MKFFLVVSFLFCFVAYEVRSQDPTTTIAPTTTLAAEATNTTAAATDGASNATRPEMTMAPKTTPEADENVIDKAYASANTSMKCKDNIKFCYGPTSTDADIKGKDITKGDNDDVCGLLKAGKSCIEKTNSGSMCSEDEYEDLREAICFSPRTVASILIVAFFCFISKLVSQQ